MLVSVLRCWTLEVDMLGLWALVLESLNAVILIAPTLLSLLQARLLDNLSLVLLSRMLL